MADQRHQELLITNFRRAGLIVSGAVLVVLLLVWWQASAWYETYLLTEARADTQRQLIPYGTALTTGINQRFAQLEGLAAFARTHPSIEALDEGFAVFAEGLYTGKDGIRAIQLFPKDGYEYVYPTLGNEAVLGRTLDDLINDERPNVKADVQRAIETRQITTSGPYELRQGGLGFLARLAVYQDDTLWGMAVIILDMPSLLDQVGIDAPPEDSELAIRDSAEQVFVGQDSVFDADPILYQVALPEGTWTLAMIPDGGWHAAIRYQLFAFRLGALVMVGLAFGLTFITMTRQARLSDAVKTRTAELTESQERYRTLFESNTDALFVLDAQGRIVDVNESACRNYGYDLAELLAMTPSDLAAPALRGSVPNRIADALSGQTRFEWRHRRKDSTELPVEISARSFLLDNQPHILSSVRDISERKHAEDALKLSEARLRVSTEMAGVAVWEYDMIANRMARSANHDQLYGLEPQEEWVIDTFLEATHPDDRARSNQIIQDAVAPGGPDHYAFDFRVVWPDESIHWLAVTGEIVKRNAQGMGELVHGCLIDITDRKQAEEALRVSEAKYRGVVEQSLSGIYIFAEDRFLYVNDRFAEMFGYSKEEVLRDLKPTDVVAGPDKPVAHEYVRRRLEGETDSVHYSVQGIKKDGTLLWIEIHGTRAVIDGESVVTGTVLDITERKTIEDALIETTEQLQLTVSAANVGLWDWNLLTNEVYYSLEWKYQIGYEDHEISNDFSEWQSRVHPDDFENAITTVQKHLANPYPHYQNEFRFQHKNGTYRWILAQASLTYDENDRPVRMRGSHIDITERKLVELEMRKHSIIIESITDAVITTDTEGYVTSWNKGAENLYGYTKDEALGELITIIYKDKNLSNLESLIARLMAKEDIRNVEVTSVNKTGQDIEVLMSLTTIQNEQANVIEIVGLSRDITERKQSEEALRKSEEKFRGVYEQSPLAIQMYDREGKLIDVNPRTLEIYGVDDKKHLLGYDMWSSPHLTAEKMDALKAGQTVFLPASLDFELVKETNLFPTDRSGIIHLEMYAIPFVREGELSGYIVQMVEVTDRRQAEQQLRLSEKLFSDAFHVGPAGTIITRIADGKFIDANESFCEMFGFSRDEVIGYTSTDLNMWTPEARSRVIQQQLESGGLHNFELVAQTKSGRLITVLFSSSEMQIKGEACRLTTMIDITERKQAESALVESEKRYRMLFENMNAGFVLFEVVQDDQGVPVDLIIRAANEGFENTTGLNAQDVIGKHLTKALPGIENDDADWIGTYGEIALTGESQQFEQGSELLGYFFSVAAFQIGPKLCAVTFVDITERKQAEIAIRKLNEELEQRIAERTAQLEVKARELETFNYSVSHDLKAPLRGIDGYSRLLLEDYLDQLDDEGRTFLRNIRHAANQMSQLIDDLLIYSRLERRELTAAQVNPEEELQTLIAEFDDLIQAQGISVTMDVPCRALSADREGLAMVLRNLIENAIKFTRETTNPHIEIGGHNTDASCLIWVRDNGIGFDMQYHDRIFEIFQRLHRAEDYAGTGVGLAIVKKAVERMNGRVWAESEPGRGATFYLEIPR